MKSKCSHRSAFLDLHILIALVVFLTAIFIALFSSADLSEAARQSHTQEHAPNGDQFTPSDVVQEAWVARYNGPDNEDDKASAMVVDGSGNVYVTGWSYTIESWQDYLTIKYNSTGEPQWIARYNGLANSNDVAAAIAVDASGNVYVTGNSYGFDGYAEYATVKYNSTGQEQWVARYNGPGIGADGATALALDTSGNIYVTGGSTGPSQNLEFATIKYNSAGQQQWVARDSGGGARAIAVDASGNAYVTGSNGDYVTIKYDSAGQRQWIATYDGGIDNNDEAAAIAVAISGDVFVTGKSVGLDGYHSYATIKYNSAGQEQWVARYVGPAGRYNDEATAIGLDGSGNVYVTGISVSFQSSADYATLKYNSAGQRQWVARYNGPAYSIDEAFAMALDSAGNVYVTGYSYSNPSYNPDYATVKYDSTGQEQWVARYNGFGTGDDIASAIAVDRFGNVYVTGSSVAAGTGNDYATIKYDQIRSSPTPRRRPTPHARQL